MASSLGIPSETPATATRDVEKSGLNQLKPPEYTSFSLLRQRLILTIVTLAGFFSPLCGAIYLPSLVLFEKIFNTTSDVINASVSVYMAVFAIAPLFGAAASDYGGRKGVYLTSLAVFLVANTLLAALPPNLGALFTLRVFQAIGASMVTSVGAGTIADITIPSKRASRMGIFLLGPHLGPILGPFIGGQFSHESRWRWVFGFLSLACFPVYLAILFLLPETLRCLVGNGSHWAKAQEGWKDWFVVPKLKQKKVVSTGDEKRFPRPPKPTVKGLAKILTWLPNLIVTVAGGLNFGGLYCIYVVFPRVWQRQYHWSGRETGYAFLVPGIALLCASLASGRISDFLYRRFKAQNNGTAPAPERRLNLQIHGYLLSAAGKVLFGWFTLHSFHPAAILIAASVSSVGTGIIMVTTGSYQTECMPTQAASLVALSGMLRNGASSISAAIMDPLLEGMGFGWCFTGLAILDATCVTGLAYIRMRGYMWRERMPVPKGSPGGPENLGESPKGGA